MIAEPESENYEDSEEEKIELSVDHQLVLEESKNKRELPQLLKKPQSFFVKRFRATWLVMIAIVLVGSFSYFTLPREANPEVKVPFGIVTTVFPGASPRDVEELVTDKIEKHIATLEDLEEVTSSSQLGVSSVAVEFKADADIDDSIRNLRDKVDDAKSDLPEDAFDPIVRGVSFSAIPILEMSLFGNYDLITLQEYADDLKEVLEKIKNVDQVQVFGGLKKEIQVVLDPEKMTLLNLDVQQVTAAIQNNNLNMPLGEMTVGSFNYSLRLEGEVETATEVANLPVTVREGKTILIKDIAKVALLPEEQNVYSRVSLAAEPSKTAISLLVTKSSGGSISGVVEEAVQEIEKFEAEVLPPDIDLEITTDWSKYVDESFEVLNKNGLQTILIVFCLLLLVLGLKEALIASSAIPFSFLITLIVILVMDGTLNTLTLFGLILALGLLIDTAIVIVEGCFEYVHTGRYTPFEAAILAIRDFKTPLTAGTLTTVAAFFPILLTPGILGQFIKWLPITISSVLLASLFISLSINATLCSKLLKSKKKLIKDTFFKRLSVRLFKVRDRFRSKIEMYYKKTLITILESKIKRRLMVGGAWVLFLMTLSMPFVGLLKIEMFPQTDQDIFYIQAELPAGSKLAKTDEVAREIEEILYEVPEIENFLANVGAESSGDNDVVSRLTQGANSHIASFTINIPPDTERERKSIEITDYIRKETKKIQGAEIFVQEISEGPPSGAPIEGRIMGEDLDKLVVITNDVADILRSIEGAIDVETTIKPSAGEYILYVDPLKANQFGLSVAQIAGALRTVVTGSSVSEILKDGEEYDIVVKFDEDKINTFSDLDKIYLNSPIYGKIPLASVTKSDLTSGIASINHRDEERVFRVRSYVGEGRLVQDVTKEFREKLADYELEEGYTIDFGGEFEDIEESFTALFQSMIIGIILILTILVLQFNSFKQPLIILFTIPLATIGVFLGLFITGLTVSFPAFLGVVGLVGIAVNDAIILIDKVNVNRKKGMQFFESIIQGALSRLQPIFLTTVTTIGGIMPLALSDPFWAPLGAAIIFGLATASFLTLFIVPAMYLALERKSVVVSQ